jgi:tetratricopeptide (TPR) repeat protein
MTAVVSTDNRILQAVETLKAFDRKGAVRLLRDELEHGAASGERWRSFAQLAFNIGELDLSHEGARRYAQTEPRTLDRMLSYCRELIRDGLIDRAQTEINSLPADVQSHSSVLHLRGSIATQVGDFAAAEALFRQALAQTPLAPQSWFALSVIKKFTTDDPDIVRMEALKGDIAKGAARTTAQFYYALAKAYDDAGDIQKAFVLYCEGAALMRAEEKAAPRSEQFAKDLVRDFTPDKLDLLRPSGCDSRRAIFVNGLPRSGTTLVEQILTSHSQVADGAELNLWKAALIPAGDFSLLGALNYQVRAQASPDPWGDLARDYLGMLTQRFGADGRIVDKTLNHSRMMGLLLHSLPNAKVIWLRRRPEDCALSCFRTFFTAPMPWSWDPADIGAHFRMDDMLHAHWAGLFPDRILTVPYEELTADPQTWIRRILAHVDLPEEPQVYEPHKTKRSVMTASVAQVRQPISTARVGAADTYTDFVRAFRAAYSV